MIAGRLCRSLAVFGILACSRQALSEDSTSTHTAQLTVRSTPDSAWVRLDTTLVGRTPITLDSVAPGLHRLRILHPDLTNWFAGVVDDTVRLVEGKSRTVAYRLDPWLLLASSPGGASVYAGDSLLGTTPLLLRPGDIPSPSPLNLKKPGFATASVNPSLAVRGALTVPLTAEWEPGLAEETDAGSAALSRRGSLRVAISGTAAVLAGAAAAYLKELADERQLVFLQTGDPALSAERRRLDTASAIALIAAQISLGFFIAFLLSE